jgi:beta-lactamase superfamily II metal-dependent hydrolase
VEFACLSHPHIDHYRGYATLLNELIGLDIPIREYWDFGASAKKAKAMRRAALTIPQRRKCDEFEQLCRTQNVIRKQGTHYRIIATPADSFWTGHDTTVDVVAPESEFVERYVNYLSLDQVEERCQYAKEYPHAADDNAVSCGLMLKYGKFSMLLGGDVPSVVWKAIIFNRGAGSVSCDALKVSHHGSMQGSFLSDHQTLWEAASRRPLTAVISGGYRSHCPHPKTMSSLVESKTTTYCTGDSESSDVQPFNLEGVDPAVLQLLELQGMCQVSEHNKSWHGNVSVECGYDGSCSVVTEFEGGSENDGNVSGIGFRTARPSFSKRPTGTR